MGSNKTDTESNSDRPEPTDNHTFAAEQLLDADPPVIIIGQHAGRHETVSPTLEIAEAVAADVIVDEQIRSALPDTLGDASVIGSLSETEQRARRSETMLVVGYEIDELAQLPYEDHDGYAIQIAPGERDEWIEYRAELSDRPNVLSQSAADLTLLGNPAEDATLLARAVTQVAHERAQSESESVTVYGSPENDTPATPPREEVEIGDSYRVATVRKCEVCHTKTNKWEIGGYPTAGPRQYCPAGRGSHVSWPHVDPPERHVKHNELAELCERRAELEQRLARYDTDTEATKRTVQQIHDELETLDAKIRELREWFDGRFDDVKGVDPEHQEVPTFSP